MGVVLLFIGSLTPSARAGDRVGTPEVMPLALSPAERSAVVADAGGELHLVRAGEPLPGGAGVLVEVLADRLVVDLLLGPPTATAEDGAGGRPAVPLRAWIYPPERPGTPPRVERLDPQPPDDLPAESLIVPEAVPERLPEGVRVARPPARPPAGGGPAAPPGSAGADGGAGGEPGPPESGPTAAEPGRDAAAGGDS